MNKENNRGASAPLPFTGVETFDEDYWEQIAEDINKSYVLTLTDLNELVNHVIKKKFWSFTEVTVGLTTIDIIKQYLNNGKVNL